MIEQPGNILFYVASVKMEHALGFEFVYIITSYQSLIRGTGKSNIQQKNVH